MSTDFKALEAVVRGIAAAWDGNGSCGCTDEVARKCQRDPHDADTSMECVCTCHIVAEDVLSGEIEWAAIADALAEAARNADSLAALKAERDRMRSAAQQACDELSVYILTDDGDAADLVAAHQPLLKLLITDGAVGANPASATTGDRGLATAPAAKGHVAHGETVTAVPTPGSEPGPSFSTAVMSARKSCEKFSGYCAPDMTGVCSRCGKRDNPGDYARTTPPPPPYTQAKHATAAPVTTDHIPSVDTQRAALEEIAQEVDRVHSCLRALPYGCVPLDELGREVVELADCVRRLARTVGGGK